ncbi:hypothetical protein ABZ470_15620 [Streptosporangium sp. NPDC020072]|uniref:hypothetical protein n=1 Tax=Streptosporangium sp. NPDC020072 TaxID=3154788 RepID=UPI003442AB3D
MLLEVSVVLIGGLSLLNLLLTLAVIRRIRRPSASMGSEMSPISSLVLDKGMSPAPFKATLESGNVFSSESWATWTVVAFFSDTCSACREKIPSFTGQVQEIREHAARNEREAPAVINVVVGDYASCADMVVALEKTGEVVVEPTDGSLVKAFQVKAFPVMCLLDEAGFVTAVGMDLESLLSPIQV